MAKYTSNASSAIWWRHLVAKFITKASNTIYNQCKQRQLVAKFTDLNHFEMILAEKDFSSHGLNTLGPLCLWQCLILLSCCQALLSILTFLMLQLSDGHRKKILWKIWQLTISQLLPMPVVRAGGMANCSQNWRVAHTRGCGNRFLGGGASRTWKRTEVGLNEQKML